AADERRLLANGRWNEARRVQKLPPDDFRPVVCLVCPWSTASWLLTELRPGDCDLAYGLCDLGVGFPEVAYFRLSELAAVRGPRGLKIERDRSFRPTKSLSAYAAAAWRLGRMTPETIESGSPWR